MKILCLISSVPDTTSKIQFTADQKGLDRTGVTFIINPYDDYALARAAELKESRTDTQVTVLTVGAADTDALLRKALALGLDEAVRINALPQDAFQVASEIAAFVKTKDFDLLLFGKESIDYNGSQVAGMVAALLDWPYAYAVTSLEIGIGKIRLWREIEGGKESLEMPLPAVIAVTKGIAEWRIPNVRGIMQAKTKPLHVVNPQNSAPRVEPLTYEQPPAKGTYRAISPDKPEELVQILVEKGFI
ncbi:MAG: electron transfer flavoprotein subunit beta/FixA family protein [Bacteroidia bacterium]